MPTQRAGAKSRSQEHDWVKVNFVLDREIADRLREVAFHQGENQSGLLRRLLNEYFRRPEIRKVPHRALKRD